MRKTQVSNLARAQVSTYFLVRDELYSPEAEACKGPVLGENLFKAVLVATTIPAKPRSMPRKTNHCDPFLKWSYSVKRLVLKDSMRFSPVYRERHRKKMSSAPFNLPKDSNFHPIPAPSKKTQAAASEVPMI
jgi:hypothetical protein